MAAGSDPWSIQGHRAGSLVAAMNRLVRQHIASRSGRRTGKALKSRDFSDGPIACRWSFALDVEVGLSYECLWSGSPTISLCSKM